MGRLGWGGGVVHNTDPRDKNMGELLGRFEVKNPGADREKLTKPKHGYKGKGECRPLNRGGGLSRQEGNHANE